MSKFIYTLFFGFIVSVGAQAQIKLIGATYNMGTSTIDLVQWAAFDETSVETTPTTLEAYLFATSSFDPQSSNYYIGGIVGQNTGLYTFNTDEGEGNLTTGVTNTNIATFDMSTSVMYNLLMETPGYIDIYAFDTATNEDSLIGTIYEEGAMGLVADAIGFDSNNGILYYVGMTNDPALALYAVPVRESTFSFTRTILSTPDAFNNITSLNYDNVNERLFASNDTYDQNGDFTGRHIVEIDIPTGDVTSLGQLSEFLYFVGGSSLFDQNTGTFLLVGIAAGNMLQMIAFDTATNTYITGFVPDNVSEIECDNTLFARSFYATAGLATQEVSTFKMYPNPASDALQLEFSAGGPMQVRIFNALGEEVHTTTNRSSSPMRIDVSAWAPGIYTVQLTSALQTTSQKVMVK